MNVPVFRKTVSGSVHELRDVESVVEGSQSRTAVHVQIRHCDVRDAVALCGTRTL